MASVGRFNTKPEKPNRLLTDDELAQLMGAAPHKRQLLYRTALDTGYRAKELRALKVRNLDRFGPSLPLAGAFTKNRDDARQPISRELAEELTVFSRGQPPDSPLLRAPRKETMTENLNRDFKKARVPKETPEGRATFHSFRVNYINTLAESGADLKTIMTLARHKSAQMSMETYCKAKPTRLRAVAEAVARKVKEAISGRESATGVARAVAGSKENAVSPTDGKAYGGYALVPPPGFEPGTH